jgi:hypothetical protein
MVVDFPTLLSVEPNASIECVIEEFRRTLPNSSKTAQAIDRREPPSRIALIAVQEGYKGYRAFAIKLLELIEAGIVADRAVVSSGQSADSSIPVHAGRGVAVADRALDGPHQPADIVAVPRSSIMEPPRSVPVCFRRLAEHFP